MSGDLILDTGPWVALVDRSERRHEECVEALAGWNGRILTTEAVLTETLHLVGPSWQPRRACLEFVFRGAVVPVPSSVESLRRVSELMEKYADRPMDFADATLVALAEDVGSDQVFTLDNMDFSIYRRHGDQTFRVIP